MATATAGTVRAPEFPLVWSGSTPGRCRWPTCAASW